MDDATRAERERQRRQADERKRRKKLIAKDLSELDAALKQRHKPPDLPGYSKDK